MRMVITAKNENLREIDRKLIYACENLNSQAVYQFIKDGADVNVDHGEPLSVVTDCCMMDDGEDYKVDPRTYGIIKLLLDSGAKPDGDDPENTPLLHFVHRNYEICELLVSKGANVNFCIRGETVLDHLLHEIWAYGDDTPKGIRHGYAKTLRLLEQHNAMTFEELVEKRRKAKAMAKKFRNWNNYKKNF